MKKSIKHLSLALVYLATASGAATFTNPITFPAVGADPFILKHDGVYYLYSTSENYLAHTGIPVYTSTNMVDWTGPCGAGPLGLALHEDDVWGDDQFWGGDVVEKDGKFYMYATVNGHLVAAVSDSPLGPFTQAVKQPMHPTDEIDAGVFEDDDGKYYIYFVRFEGGNVEYAAELSDDMLTMKEETITFCLAAQEGTWERTTSPPESWPVLEGAYCMKHNGLYYLIYTANHFQSIDYAMGYATSTSPLGPWTRYAGNPVLARTAEVSGPGNGMVVSSPDDSELYICYHTHYTPTLYWPRRVALDKVWFETDPLGGPDIFVVDGPTIAPQPYPSGGVPDPNAGVVDTIAYWRFEEGTAGVAHAGDLDDWYQDVSGNANHMASYWSGARPTAIADQSFSTIPQTGATNLLALDFVPNNDICTFGSKMVNTYRFNKGWTVEFSVKFHSLNAGVWQVPFGKAGRKSDVFGAGDEPPLTLKIVGDSGAGDFRHMFLSVVDNAGVTLYVTGSAPLETNKWYDVAVTYDNIALKLYIKKEGGTGDGYQNFVRTSNGVFLDQWNEPWCVGRGTWGGAAFDFINGTVDEVRISNGALDPSRFIHADGDVDDDDMADFWELKYFTNIAVCLPEVDTEGDGLENFLEYALGGNPTNDDAAAISPTTRFIDANTWEYVYNRRVSGLTGLDYSLAYKFDLFDASWTSSAGANEVGVDRIGSDLETVTNVFGVTGLDKAFLQLEISR